ncbi:hypothetical protein L798_02100 [Zootermopsis nevadensis]|uniref:Uncharacterized protein n=1 Tax=Zootermopsis nevadensis TaxID=136037 RepID=A0A067RE71_ZOONE|nr:hypothetical protein L798_02100 [Zootermopsis nevadensis]
MPSLLLSLLSGVCPLRPATFNRYARRLSARIVSHWFPRLLLPSVTFRRQRPFSNFNFKGTSRLTNPKYNVLSRRPDYESRDSRRRFCSFHGHTEPLVCVKIDVFRRRLIFCWIRYQKLREAQRRLPRFLSCGYSSEVNSASFESIPMLPVGTPLGEFRTAQRSGWQH